MAVFNMAFLAGLLKLPADADAEKLEAGVQDLVALRPKVQALEQELATTASSLAATSGKLDLETSAHAATRMLLQEAKVKAEAIPEAAPAPADGKYKVGDKALLGATGEVEITEVMPSQPCYMAKSGEATICAAEQMLAPVTPAVAAAAADAKGTFTMVAELCNSKMTASEIESLAWQFATGAIKGPEACALIKARPAIPAGAIEALEPVPGKTQNDGSASTARREAIVRTAKARQWEG